MSITIRILKKLSLVLSLLLLTQGVFATGSQEPADDGEITLEYWTYVQYSTGTVGEMFRDFADEFEAANPGVTVEIVGKPDTEIHAGVVAGASSGQLPDLYNMAYNTGYEVSRINAVQDVKDLWDALPEEYRAQFSPNSVNGLSVNGKVYGIPYTLYSTILFRNRTVLSKSGINPDKPISNWTEWLDQMKKVKEAGYIAFPNYTVDGWLVWHLLGGVSGIENGLTTDGKTTITADQLASAYELLLKISQYGTEVGPFDAAATDLFISDQMAFYSMGPWADPTFKDKADNSDFDYDYVLIPGQDSSIKGGVHGGEFFAIAPGPNVEMAFKFAQFMCDKEQIGRFAAKFGRPSFNSAAMAMPEVEENDLVVITSESANGGMADAAYFKNFPLAVRQPITDYAIRTVEGEMTPKEAAEMAISEMNEILAD